MATLLPATGCGGGGGAGGADVPAKVMGWGSASEMETASGVTSMLYPQLASFPDGRAVAAWMEVLSGGTYQIAAMLYEPGSGWHDRTVLGFCANNTRATVKPYGANSAYVAWRSDDEQIALARFVEGQWVKDSNGAVLHSKTEQFGTSWVRWLSSTRYLHVFPDGKAILLTTAALRSENSIFPDQTCYAVCFDGNTFGSPVMVGPSFVRYAFLGQCAPTSNGKLLVLQMESNQRAIPPADQSGSIVSYVFGYDDVLNDGDACRFGTLLRSGGTNIKDIKLTADSEGYFVVAWIEATITRDSEYRVIRSAGNLYSVRLEGWNTIEPLDDGGNVEAVYALRPTSGNSLLVCVEGKDIVATDVGTRESQTIATAGGSITRLTHASDESGNHMILWDETIPNDGDDTSEMTTFDDNAHTIRACQYRVGSGWQEPKVVAENGLKDSCSLALALDSLGNAVALWDQRVGDTNWDTRRFYRSVWAEPRKILHSRLE